MSLPKIYKTPTQLGLITYDEALDKAIDYAIKRKSGVIKSIKTPFEKMNKMMMDGIEWNSFTVIGGRSATGKSLLSNIITCDSFDLNTDQDFCVLDFQFEMLARNSGLRTISAKTSIPTRRLSSVGELMTDEDLVAAKKYVEANRHKPIYICERPKTVIQMGETIDHFVNHMNKHVLVTVDHSLLLRKDSSENDRMNTLFNLGNMLAELRRNLPISVVLLSQLNRDVDSLARMEEGTIGNYVKDSDIYGSDALLQFSDTLIGINRPMKNDIRYYGPHGYLMEKNTIAVHFLKVRNGKTGLTFMEADFEKATMKELETLPHTKKEMKSSR